MPTLILLDNSLSMCKYTSKFDLQNEEKPLNFLNISHLIITEIIKHIKVYDKQECCALVTMSSNQVICPFTSEQDKLLKSIENIKIGSRINIESSLNFASDYIVSEWGCFTHVEIIIITDGFDSLSNESSLKVFCEKNREKMRFLKEKFELDNEEFDETINNVEFYQNETLNNFNEMNNESMVLKFPFTFSNSLNLILLEEVEKTKNSISESRRNLFSELIKLNNNNGKLFVSNNLKINYIINDFAKGLLNKIYEKFIVTLKCGHLEQFNLLILPAPKKFKGYQYHEYVEREIAKTIEIYGFLSISDLTNPPTFSRHVLLPSNNEDETTFENTVLAKMIHNSLNSLNMGAIVCLGTEWYGYIHPLVNSKNDPKKKSNLMLSIFMPGEDILLNSLRKICVNSTLKLPTSSQEPVFKQNDVKSYAKNSIMWLKQNNLVSDMQKIVRNAKKMPEKIPTFYKELNKIRRAALSFGFYELFEGMAQMLEREACTINNQESLLQLNHTIRALRSPEYKEYKNDILPFILKQNK